MKQTGGEVRSQRFLRKRAVLEKTGLRQSTLYDLMKRREFPQSVPIGRKAVAWLESEIDDWMAERIAQRDAKSAA